MKKRAQIPRLRAPATAKPKAIETKPSGKTLERHLRSLQRRLEDDINRLKQQFAAEVQAALNEAGAETGMAAEGWSFDMDTLQWYRPAK